MQASFALYRHCTLCPRACGVDRTSGKAGVCHIDATCLVAHSMLHAWEEPCLSGTRGSGTVFFSGCPLGCVYCQNHAISRGRVGKPYTQSELAALFLSLEAQGAHNVNLVTAQHFLPHVCEVISRAKEKGLSVPIVYNTSGYESVESLKMLTGLVDIYLTDFRYLRADTAKKYSSAPDYPTVSERALAEMVAQTGAPVFDGEGMMTRGTLVRLLLLPSHLIEAKQILRRVYTAYGDRVYISLMSQYTPTAEAAAHAPALGRRVSAREYASFVAYARTLGVTQAFVQEGSAASESFIPDFNAKKD